VFVWQGGSWQPTAQMPMCSMCQARDRWARINYCLIILIN
jgi:hypothetical protein